MARRAWGSGPSRSPALGAGGVALGRDFCVSCVPEAPGLCPPGAARPCVWAEQSFILFSFKLFFFFNVDHSQSVQ